MANSIKEVFEEEAGNLKIDRNLYREISRFERGFVNRDDNSIAFFGGNLLGVYPIRFVQNDRNQWFDEVLDIDDYSAREKLHGLDSINPSFHVQSDIFNMSCLWLLHAIYSKGTGSSREKEAAMLDVLLILHYRFLSSLMAHNFPYPADPSTALAAYAVLSKKFALKQHGNWWAYLKARCEDIMSRNSIHRTTIEKFNDDEAITWMIGDIQDRLRKAVRKMVEVFHRVRREDEKIGFSRSSGVDMEGNIVVKDRLNQHNEYRRYLKEIISDKRSLIKKPILEVVSGAMHTMNERHLEETLAYVSDNYRVRGEKNIDILIDETLQHAFDVMGRDEFRRNFSLATFLTRLRALYMASRSSDPAVAKMKEIAEKIVEKATRSRNPSVISSVRTGLFLYLVLRTITREYFD